MFSMQTPLNLDVISHSPISWTNYRNNVVNLSERQANVVYLPIPHVPVRLP